MEKTNDQQEETAIASVRPKHKPEKKISFVSESVYEAEMAKHEKEAMQKEDEEFRKKNEKEAGVKEEKNMFILIAIIILAFALIFGGVMYKIKTSPKTIDDMHDMNIKGKLSPDQGYVYNGYSFVRFSDTLMTRFMRQETGQQYNVQLRYGPRELEDILIEGDYTDFLKFNSTYITFDPKAENLSYVALAASDLSQNLMGVLNIAPFAACSKNETGACRSRPIVDGCKTDFPAIYIKISNTTKITAKGSCVLVEGNGFGLIRAVDRLLLAFFGIMP